MGLRQKGADMDVIPNFDEGENWSNIDWDAQIELIEFKSMTLQDLINQGYTRGTD